MAAAPPSVSTSVTNHRSSPPEPATWSTVSHASLALGAAVEADVERHELGLLVDSPATASTAPEHERVQDSRVLASTS